MEVDNYELEFSLIFFIKKKQVINVFFINENGVLFNRMFVVDGSDVIVYMEVDEKVRIFFYFWNINIDIIWVFYNKYVVDRNEIYLYLLKILFLSCFMFFDILYILLMD